MRSMWLLCAAVWLAGLAGCNRPPRTQPPPPPDPVSIDQLSRVSTAVPFPRGLQLVDGRLYVLARGRVRESGGADGAIDDQAGTIFLVDPEIAQPVTETHISPQVRHNGTVFAVPTEPPFKLLDRSAVPATRDRETDRPYCTLRYDPVSRNFYICAFSGIDKPQQPGARSSFSKNVNDAVLRYDTRSGKWYDVERHSLEAGGNYPHHDPHTLPPPHGWLNGPDNCLVVGRWLYCVAKDNSVLVRYDLSEIVNNPDAPPPKSYWVMDDKIQIRGQGLQSHLGHSMLAERDGWLYIGFRTSSTILRLRLDEQGLPVEPILAELIARFDAYDPHTGRSANLTDMVFGPEGDLYVIAAQPARIYRFRPDPDHVFDGRSGRARPWADLAALTNNPRMKSENVLVDSGGRVFVTSGDAYDAGYGIGG
ncbi:MAG TPA: hypothetical protein VNL70_08525, partial [Tepidisphaeraceae bacterium]|nr:hypothetical protein [Tepidisphaeraceae bacterium]